MQRPERRLVARSTGPPDHRVVELQGELDVASVGELEQELEPLFQARARRIVVDLRALQFIDSSGLRALLRFDARARADGGCRFELVPGPPAVQRLFDVTGATRLLSFTR